MTSPCLVRPTGIDNDACPSSTRKGWEKPMVTESSAEVRRLARSANALVARGDIRVTNPP